MNYKELLNNLKGEKWWEYLDDAIEALAEYDAENGGLDIVSLDTAEEIAKHELDEGGLLRLKCFLDGVSLTEDYYYIDGYGNLQNITKDWVEMQLEDIIDQEARA